MSYVELSNMYKVYGEDVLAVNDFNLSIKENEFVALIGPSGCGKSTLLRMIAGLEEISYGDLLIKGNRMNNVHAKDRDIAMVFQNYALYPHLDISDNIAFGLKLRKADKEVIKEQVTKTAEILDLTDYMHKKPNELSGGQRQRVALGRAMVQGSRIFLMDEPLSNLDAKLRGKMRIELLKLHKQLGVTTIYVTHDQVEAMTMADRIVVLNKGEVQQIGTPYELYSDPKNIFVATFIGDPEINLIKATVRNNTLKMGNHVLTIPDRLNTIKDFEGKEIMIGLRPETVVVNESEEIVENQIDSTVQLVEMRGDHFIVTTQLNEQLLQLKMVDAHHFALDDKLSFSFNLEKALFFDPETEQRIL